MSAADSEGERIGVVINAKASKIWPGCFAARLEGALLAGHFLEGQSFFLRHHTNNDLLYKSILNAMNTSLP
jgi:hypothetical protein